MTNYKHSKTMTYITDRLNERYNVGEVKYGEHVDDMRIPTEVTGEQTWLEMVENELLDGVTYVVKAAEERQRLVGSVESLKADNEKLRHDLLVEESELDDLYQLNAELHERLEARGRMLHQLQREFDNLTEKYDALKLMLEQSESVRGVYEERIENLELLLEEATKEQATDTLAVNAARSSIETLSYELKRYSVVPDCVVNFFSLFRKS